MDESAKKSALKDLLGQVKSWKKDSMRQKYGKQKVQTQNGKKVVQQDKEQSDRQHSILNKLLAKLKG